MRQNIILLFLLIIFTSKSSSQTSDFTIEANYPILIDDNYYGREFNGIIDIGAKYRFTEFKTVKIGAALNSGLLVSNSFSNREISDFKITSYLIQPKIFAEIDLSKIHPFVGVGYSFLISDISGTLNGIDASNGSDTKNGINVNFGTSYYLTNKLFIQVQYDFVKLGLDEVPSSEKFMTNMNILKLGLGLRL